MALCMTQFAYTSEAWTVRAPRVRRPAMAFSGTTLTWLAFNY